MAYSPVGQGDLPTADALAEVAQRHGVTTYQIALAWVLRDPNTIAIPKAADIRHVEANRAAADLALTAEDFAALDAEFAPPTRKTRLAML
jgi:diketogulonate reductase-like aldo/keto reductase